MRIIRGIDNFPSGPRETVAAEHEMTPPPRFRWAVLVFLLIILSALTWILIAVIR
jgi:hypothetical protein